MRISIQEASVYSANPQQVIPTTMIQYKDSVTPLMISPNRMGKKRRPSMMKQNSTGKKYTQRTNETLCIALFKKKN
ncbi:hypothetical protein OKN5_14280 [Bacillus altitudinis]